MCKAKNKHSGFSGSLGFVLAAADSAVGVGNIWRFPYLCAKDGDGLFLLVYLVLVLTFGFTLLTTDVAIGRRTKQNALNAFGTLHKKLRFLGYLTFLVPTLIMTYYSVIGGWIAKYFAVYLVSDGTQAAQDGFFTSFITSQVSPIIFMLLFLGVDGMASGPSLTFISLSRVFASMGGVGRIVGIVFFLALGFAALTSCVSVMETLVANCMEIFHKSRKEMCAMVGVYSLVTAILICLGYNVFYFELPLPNGNAAQLLDVMDYISNSFLMPFISLLTSILIGWVIGPKWVIDEVEKNGEHFGRAKLYSVMMRYVVPVVMLILFLTSTGFWNLLFRH